MDCIIVCIVLHCMDCIISCIIFHSRQKQQKGELGGNLLKISPLQNFQPAAQDTVYTGGLATVYF